MTQITVNPHYYASILRSFARRRHPSSASDGRYIHAHILKTGLLSSSSSVSSALFHMYTNLGPPSSALLTFRHYLVSPTTLDFTALLSCHLRYSLPFVAIQLFFSSVTSVPISTPPDDVTMAVVFSAASKLRNLTSGTLAHLIAVKHGVWFGLVGRNAAMDMYAKCGAMGDARKVFGEMKERERSVVSWSVILWGALEWEGLESGRELFDKMPVKNQVAWSLMAAAYVENGIPRKAMWVLGEMVGNCGLLNLNHVSVCSLLSACVQVGDVTIARWVHVYALKARLLFNVVEDVAGEEHQDNHQILMVGSALIDAYAKCGRIESAWRLFRSLSIRNVVTWNAMLTGFAMHGMGSRVTELFSRMVEEGVTPDDISFVGVLSACSRSGLVDESRKYFYEVMPTFGIRFKMEHYSCMVDVLGRAGKLEEAERLLMKMPFRPNEVVIGSLLASCATHGRIEIGKRLMGEMMEMHPLNTDYHVLMSNLYTSTGDQLKADDVRKELKRKGICKIPGISYISINGCIHQFSAGDKTHPQTHEVYNMLDDMVCKLRLTGYITEATTSKPSRVMDGYLGSTDEQEEREQALYSHSERLAVALGLISTRPKSPLHIFKNIRICNDCHLFIKHVSNITEREITVRDRNRFHCFKMGHCSCSDYW